jgi:hypothetical protein
MRQAPERIWAWKNNQPGTKYHGLPQWAPFYPTFKTPTVKVFEGTSWWNPFAGTCRDEPVNPDMAEYIRADLVPQWQPIETAPKDGTWVLLTGGDAYDEFNLFKGTVDYSVSPHVVNYPNDVSVAMKRPVVAFWNEKQSEWAFAFWDSCWYGEYSDPTHWMPLPAPPSP